MTHQIPLRDWPVGLEEDALHLALAPEEISRRSGVEFAQDHDSLDDFDGAVIDLGGGIDFALQHHWHSPAPGTTVLFRRGSSRGLREVVSFLKLRPKEVVWTAPHLEAPLKRIFRRRWFWRGALATTVFSAGVLIRRRSAGRAHVLKRAGRRHDAS